MAQWALIFGGGSREWRVLVNRPCGPVIGQENAKCKVQIPLPHFAFFTFHFALASAQLEKGESHGIP